MVNEKTFIYDDGGRGNAGFRGHAGDCVARAIAIAADLDYRKVYTALAEGNATQRRSSLTGKRSRSARNGVNVKRKWFRDYMCKLGFTWTPTMFVGSGCKVHLRADELPQGVLIVAVSKHYTCMVNGVIRDTYDPSREGTRCVYGYWKKAT